ncbi:MAG TPA: type II secretion system F family protein [Tepidisphaeraceae bacterium]|jgi:tight adherence protein B
MDNIVLPILIASTVILMILGASRALISGLSVDKRRLKQRLSTSGQQVEQASLQLISNNDDLSGLSGRLVKYGYFSDLYRRIVQAYPDMTLGRFVTIVVFLFVTLLLLVSAISNSLLIGGASALIGGYIPFFMMNSKRNKRQQTLAKQLPEALDFLSRILRAGHSLSTGLQMMGEELPQPLATEFSRCYNQHSLGQALEDSLTDMAKRIESTDFAFFITAILIQRQTGGDLSEVLTNISGMVRQRMRLQNHVRAKTAEGRFTGYILVAFPAVMFLLSYILNPEHTGIMLKDSTGLMLLGLAFGLQMLGLFAIRKITTVRV